MADPVLGDYVWVYWVVGTQYGTAGKVTGQEYTEQVSQLVAAGYGSITTRPTSPDAVPTNPNASVSRADVKTIVGSALSEPIAPQPVEIPAGLGWDSVRWPLTVTRTELPGVLRAHGTSSITPESAFDSVSAARTAPQKSLYVDIATGVDTNSGTQALPLRSLSKAIELANASGLATKVWVKAGLYNRGVNFCNSGANGPSVDVAFVAYQGRVVVTTSDTFTATVHATYPAVYSTPVAANTVNKTVNLECKTNDGAYLELTNVASIEECSRLSGSWFHDGSGVLHIHRHDGSAVTEANTRYYRASTRNFSCTNPVNLYFGGSGGNDGFDLEGGSSLGVIDVRRNNPVTGVQKVLAAANLTARYGGGKIDVAAGRGIAIESWHGLSIFSNVDASFNQSDGFNLHNVNAAPWTGMLTINCDAVDNGRLGASSCNAHTLHENAVAVDVCSRFERGSGGTIRNIGTSKGLYAGTCIADDRGDRHLSASGQIWPTALRVDDSAEVWCDSTRTKMPAGGYEYSAGVVTAKVHKRNTWPTRTPDSGVAASFDTY